MTYDYDRGFSYRETLEVIDKTTLLEPKLMAARLLRNWEETSLFMASEEQLEEIFRDLIYFCKENENTSYETTKEFIEGKLF